MFPNKNFYSDIWFNFSQNFWVGRSPVALVDELPPIVTPHHWVDGSRGNMVPYLQGSLVHEEKQNLLCSGNAYSQVLSTQQDPFPREKIGASVGMSGCEGGGSWCVDWCSLELGLNYVFFECW